MVEEIIEITQEEYEELKKTNEKNPFDEFVRNNNLALIHFRGYGIYNNWFVQRPDGIVEVHYRRGNSCD